MGFSTSDYLLRSINSAFRPLLLAGLVAVVATGVHQAVVAAVAGGSDRSPRWARHMPVAAGDVGVVLLAIGLSGIAVPDLGTELGAWLPLSPGHGLRAPSLCRAHLAPFRARAAHATPRPERQLRSFLVVGVALMALFWTVALYAHERGRQLARTIARDLVSRTEVVLYAKDRLALAGPGVQVADIHLPNSRYRYRYSGLRLLARSQERYVLLPVGWTRGRGSAYILRDDGDVRFEFTAQ